MCKIEESVNGIYVYLDRLILFLQRDRHNLDLNKHTVSCSFNMIDDTQMFERWYFFVSISLQISILMTLFSTYSFSLSIFSSLTFDIWWSMQECAQHRKKNPCVHFSDVIVTSLSSLFYLTFTVRLSYMKSID